MKSLVIFTLTVLSMACLADNGKSYLSDSDAMKWYGDYSVSQMPVSTGIVFKKPIVIPATSRCSNSTPEQCFICAEDTSKEARAFSSSKTYAFADNPTVNLDQAKDTLEYTSIPFYGENGRDAYTLTCPFHDQMKNAKQFKEKLQSLGINFLFKKPKAAEVQTNSSSPNVVN